MRIWIINPFDDLPCEGKAQRFWSLSATLADQGHEVIWWSSDWSHRRKAKREAPEEEPPRPLGTPPCQGGESGESGEVEGEKVERFEGEDSLRSLSDAGQGGGELGGTTTNDPRLTLNFQLRLVATPPYRKNISLARIWNHRVFGRQLYRDACAAIDSGALAKPDIILASLPPMEGPIAALRLRARYGCRVITDVMDAWPETLLQALSGPAKADGRWRMANAVLRTVGSAALWPYGRMLRRACRESDAVSAQSETFAAFAKAHGAKGPVHVCYLGGAVPADSANSANVEHRTSNVEGRTKGSANVELGTRNVVGTSGHPSFTTAPKGIIKATDGANSEVSTNNQQRTTPNQQPRKLRLLYLGAMGRSYDLDTILDALELLDQEGLSVECVFVGDGEKRAQLEARQVAGVRFTGFLQGEALARELSAADLGVVPFFSQSGVAIPYKAGDYLAYGLPLLNTIEGELAELVQRFHCGMSYPVLNPEALAAAIREYADDRERLRLEQRQAYACFDAHFNRAKTYPEFAKWLVGG